MKEKKDENIKEVGKNIEKYGNCDTLGKL